MKCIAACGVIVGLAAAAEYVATEPDYDVTWNEYTFKKVHMTGCASKTDGCALASHYEGYVAPGEFNFKQILRVAFDQCLEDSGHLCRIHVEVEAKIRSLRHCTTEEGISLYIPELRGWTMEQEITTDEFDVEGDYCDQMVGIHTSLEEGEKGPTCNMRNPLDNNGRVAWAHWNPWNKEFRLIFVQPVFLDTFQLMPNGASESPCKFRSANETSYSITATKEMISAKKAD